ncbi:iron-sulfur cluster assembly accessory protein [Allohahella marinimesophila]|uniref:Iron-sulfur cluster assembly protein IscA n=1 Tax=Allohahella marinimesophila TaxID=1054972 RepID=A0ABP7Q093_9GAMM
MTAQVNTVEPTARGRTLELTENARAHIAGQMQKHPDAAAFRIGVKMSGCSGYMYVVDVADAISAEDEVFDFQGTRVVVSRQALPVLSGTTVDFVKQGLNSMFRFHNPNAGASCGCGESFTTDTLVTE